MTKREGLQQIIDGEREYRRDAAKFPVGTKLVAIGADGRVGEIVAADGRKRTVRTNGVDRETLVDTIDAYVASGRARVE